MKTIAILGAGWLGEPLAWALAKESQIQVRVSTRSSTDKLKFEKKKCVHFTIDLTENGVSGDIASFLYNCDVLLIAIPPGLRKNPKGNFVAKMDALLSELYQSTCKKVVFISSTSVYDNHPEFPEVDAITKPDGTSTAGQQLITVEKRIQQQSHFTYTIIRFGGLIDISRHPATMLSGRKNLKNPLAPVNLIHRKDAISVCKHLIFLRSQNLVINTCYPQHPPKIQYYTEICRQMKIPVPEFDVSEPSVGKIITATNDLHAIGYDLKYSIYEL